MGLTFQESARGVHKDVNINVTDNCPKCNGTRCELGTKPTKCLTCNGTGMETVTTGPFVMRSSCRQCRGTGQVILNPCTECNGKGTMVQRKRVTVPVPAGQFLQLSMRYTVFYSCGSHFTYHFCYTFFFRSGRWTDCSYACGQTGSVYYIQS